MLRLWQLHLEDKALDGLWLLSATRSCELSVGRPTNTSMLSSAYLSGQSHDKKANRGEGDAQ